MTLFGELRDPVAEGEFRAHRYERELRVALRVSAVSVIVIYASFGLVDWLMVPDALGLALTLRYGVTVPVSVALAALSFSPMASRGVVLIGVVHSLLGPLLFVTVGAFAADPGGLLYTSWGAVLFPILVPQLTRLSVRWTIFVSVATLAYVLTLDFVEGGRGVAELTFMALFCLVGGGYGVWATYAAEVAARRTFWQERVIAWQMSELASERDRSERLLLNVLPESIARRLQEDSSTIADNFENVTVVFADLVGFTTYSATVPAEDLVARLDAIFSRFDAEADRLGLEKIKTIGDAYMVAAGLPEAHPDAAAAAARMALAMRDAIVEHNQGRPVPLGIRIGVHTGPVVAGVIGRRKFIYDLWGDTVNTASRMESHGAPGRVQISEATAAQLGEGFQLEARGSVEVKGKGAMKTFWLNGEAR